MFEDKFEKLKAIASGETVVPFPSIWVHEVNKPLIGKVKGFGQFQHDRFGVQETVIVELETGELVSAILNAYLIDGMRRQNAQVNDFVLIQLLGKEKSPQGNFYNKFQLIVEKS